MPAAHLVGPQLTTLHMGALHPAEQVLVLVLAFGPFLLLALVVWLRRRAERREDEPARDQADR